MTRNAPFALLSGFMLPLALTAPALAQTSASQASYAQARQVLDAGIRAAGGLEVLQAVKNVWRKGSGTVYNQGQSLKPEPPYNSRLVDVSSVADFANRRSATETATTPQGGIPTKTRAVLNVEAGFGHNLVTNLVTPSSPAGLTASRTALRRDPAAILLTASARADTARFLGEHSLEGQPHKVVTFADSDGTQIALYFDARTGLLSKYETLADHPVMGDTLTEVVLSDYRNVGPLKLPYRVVTRSAGEVTQDLKYSEIRVNSEPGSGAFEAPKDAVPGMPTAGAATVSLKKLADDVYLAEGSSHHSLVVAFSDHVLLVEAPQSDERSQAVTARIREALPGKPIKYVVLTHHHYDHSGGLRTVMAQGATIVTTPGNKAFLEKLAATPHTIRTDALSRAPRPPTIETFVKRRVFADGTRTVELHDIGPNPHVQEAVIVYLPKEKIVFQSDLIGLPAQGPLPPASPATVDFLEKVGKLGLQVETVVGGHGRVGTMEEVKKAAEVRATTK